MDQNTYRAAFDAIKFSENFEQATIVRLHAVNRQNKEAYRTLKQKPLKIAIVAAILIVVLSGTALALTALLSPKEVASTLGNEKLAAAFQSGDAVKIGKSVETGGYSITFMGIASGKGLSSYYSEAQQDQSYIVASVANTDKTPLTDYPDLTITPLVSGYKPWQVNAWTLDGGRAGFISDGVCYYVFQCSNLEIFADHTVYLAAYAGSAPDAGTFKIDDRGAISFSSSYTGPKAMFTIPFDAKKADPEAAKKLLESIGL